MVMAAESQLSPPAPPSATERSSSPPPIRLAWRDVRVTATVVGVGAASAGFQIYPRVDERLPHRKGVRAALHVAPRVAAAAPKKAAAPVVKNAAGPRPGGPVAMRPHHGASVHGLAQASRVIAKNRVLVPAQQQRKGAAGRLVKNLKCPICQKGFTKNTYLKRHIQSHSGIKPYKCDICGWGFFQHCNLKRHMTSHAQGGANSYKCLYCTAYFSTKSVLSVHMRDAHGDKAGASHHPNLVKGGGMSSILKPPGNGTNSSPPNSTTS